jgi:hypothetical protein
VFEAGGIFIAQLGEEYLEGESIQSVFNQIDDLEDGTHEEPEPYLFDMI